jgi:type III secretion protein T
MLALYFGSGGFVLTIGAVYDSYRIWPIDRFTPQFDADAGRLILQLLDQVVTRGLLLAGPVIACLFLTDLCFGLAARAAPQLQAYYLAQSAKNLLFVGLILIYFAFLLGYMHRDLGALVDAVARLGALAGRN